MSELSQSIPARMSVSTVFGMCAGYAVKRLSREAAYGAGLGFIGLQVLNFYGYITINWTTIAKDVEKAADQDGDGKFDLQDVKIMAKRGIKFLATGVPDVAGFTAGIYAGLKWL